MALGRVHDYAGLLVDDQEIVIFKDNIDRYVFRRKVAVFIGKSDAYHITFADFVPALRGFPFFMVSF